MSIERVREYFKGFGIEDRMLEFDVSSATVELAAQALGCEGKRIAKTLSFLVDGQAILIVAAGDARIDNPKYINPKYKGAQNEEYIRVPDVDEFKTFKNVSISSLVVRYDKLILKL